MKMLVLARVFHEAQQAGWMQPFQTWDHGVPWEELREEDRLARVVALRRVFMRYEVVAGEPSAHVLLRASYWTLRMLVTGGMGLIEHRRAAAVLHLLASHLRKPGPTLGPSEADVKLVLDAAVRDVPVRFPEQGPV